MTRKKSQRHRRTPGNKPARHRGQDRPIRFIRRSRLFGFVFCGLAILVLMLAGAYQFMRRSGGSRNGTASIDEGAAVTAADARTPTVVPLPDTSMMPPHTRDMLLRAHRAVREQPRSPDTWGTLGSLCEALDRYECAEACYRQGRRISPSDVRFVYNLAIVRELRGADWREVLDLFKEAARLVPDFPPVYYRMGDLLARQGQLAQACDFYRKSLDLDAELAVAHRSLGQVLLQLGQTEAAVRHLELANERVPDDGPTLAALARGLQLLGRSEPAQRAAHASRPLRSTLKLPDPVRHRTVEAARTQLRLASADGRP